MIQIVSKQIPANHYKKFTLTFDNLNYSSAIRISINIVNKAEAKLNR